MAQQPPLAPQGQGMPDMQKLLASMSPQQMQQAMQAASAMTGVDPKMLQAAQAQLANPNGGDQFQMPGGAKPMNPNDLMPVGPQQMLVGAAGGVALSKGFEQLFKPGEKGAESLMIKAARALDRLPGINRASNWLEVSVLPRIKGARADRALGRLSPEATERQIVQELVSIRRGKIPDAVVDRLSKQTTIKGLQGEISAILEHPIQNLAKEGAAGRLTPEGFRQAIWHEFKGHDIPKELRTALKREKTIPGMQRVLTEAAGKQLDVKTIGSLQGLNKYLKGVDDTFIPTYTEHQALLSALPGHAQLLRQRMPDLQAAVAKVAPSKAAEVANATTLQQVEEILGERTLKNKAVQEVMTGIRSDAVGPIGRAFLSTSQTLHRVFAGETMSDSMGMFKKTGGKGAAEKAATAAKGAAEGAGEKAAGGLSKLLGPALTGGLIIGQSLTEAHKAHKGDKVKAFFDNFMGVGMGSFLGWEVARKFLRATDLIPKLLPFLTDEMPKFLRFIPFISKFSPAGIVTEVLSIFVLSIPFQKAGEKLAHAIFGKPKKKEAETVQKQQKKATRQGSQQTNIPGGGAQAVSSLVDSRGVFSQFRKPGATATGNGSGISIDPSEISRSTARSAEDATVQSMLHNTNWDEKNLFQMGGGS